MAKETRKLEITLKPDEWKKHKYLIQKSSCACYKDPSALFLLGIQTAINTH